MINKMKISNNIASLIASRDLSQTSRAISRSLERLSTGKRVNSPADDSVAFSLATKLNGQIRGLTQANLNINQAKGIIQTADSAISTQVEIVQKMRELALQGASSTLTSTDRDSINTQLQNLREEFQRVTNSTVFGELHLLDGSLGSRNIQVGANAGQEINLQLPELTASQAFEKTVGTGSFSFSSSQNFNSASLSLTDVDLADLNSDGHLDKVFINLDASSDEKLGVQLGDGAGGFGPLQETDFGEDTAVFVELGDLDEDGILDAITTTSSGSISVLFGNGDGSFDPPTTFNTDISDGDDLSLGDFNSDGRLDVALISAADGLISVNFGSGDGSFTSETTMSASSNVYKISSGDIDNDGDLDIIATDSGADDTLSVFLNNGDSSFASRVTYAVGDNPRGVELADLDGDGNLDAIVGDIADDTLSILTGNGDGSFNARVTYAGDFSVLIGLEVEDINADGHLDIVSHSGANLLKYFGNGDGTFEAVETKAFEGTAGAFDIALGDINSDGVLDYVVAAASEYTESALGDTKQRTALADVHVNNPEDATALLSILDETLSLLTSERASLSAVSANLDSRLDYNLLLGENFTEAKSQAEDVDFALETAELVRQQILQQAQIAALSQANTNLQVVTSLLELG